MHKQGLTYHGDGATPEMLQATSGSPFLLRLQCSRCTHPQRPFPPCPAEQLVQAGPGTWINRVYAERAVYPSGSIVAQVGV